jgi:chromosome segregation ATPase
MIATGWKLATCLAALSALILALAWQRDAARQDDRISALEAQLGHHSANRDTGILQVGELGREATTSYRSLVAHQAELVKRNRTNTELRNELSSSLQRFQQEKGALSSQLSTEKTARTSAEKRALELAEELRAAVKSRNETALDLKLLRNAKGVADQQLKRVQLQLQETRDGLAAASREAKAADEARQRLAAESKAERRRMLDEHRQERARLTRDLDRVSKEAKEGAMRLKEVELLATRLRDEVATQAEALTESKKLNTDFRKRNRGLYNRVLKLEEEAKIRIETQAAEMKKLEDERDGFREEAKKLKKQLEDLIKARDDMAANVRSFERAHFDKMKRFPVLVKKVSSLERELETRPALETLARRGDLERRAITAEAAVEEAEARLGAQVRALEATQAARREAESRTEELEAVVAEQETEAKKLALRLREQDAVLRQAQKEIERLEKRLSALGG